MMMCPAPPNVIPKPFYQHRTVHGRAALWRYQGVPSPGEGTRLLRALPWSWSLSWCNIIVAIWKKGSLVFSYDGRQLP
jgi:hypothetical protein